MKKELYAGVSLGTSGVEVGLFDIDGNLEGYGKVPHEQQEVETPDGIHRYMNSETLFEGLGGATAIALQNADAVPDDIAAVAFSGAMHSADLLLDDDSHHDVMTMWNDQSNRWACNPILGRVGADDFRDITGIAYPIVGYQLPKIVAVIEREPELWERVKKVLFTGGSIVERLTGETVADPSDLAGSGYFDVENRKVSDFILDKLGIDKDKLPTMVASSAAVGRVREAVAGSVNLSPNTLVAYGGGDCSVADLSHALSVEDAVLSFGSSGTGHVMFGRYFADGSLQPFLMPNDSADFNDAQDYLLFCQLTCANQLTDAMHNYFMDNEEMMALFESSRGEFFRRAVEEARKAPAGSNGLLNLNLRDGSRVPDAPSDVASIHGIGKATETMMKSPLYLRMMHESVAFSLLYGIKDVTTDKIKRYLLTGGASENDLYNEIVASTLGEQSELIVREGHPGEIFGAYAIALAAKLREDGQKDITARQLVQERIGRFKERRIQSNKRETEVLNDMFVVYCAYQKALETAGVYKLHQFTRQKHFAGG